MFIVQRVERERSSFDCRPGGSHLSCKAEQFSTEKPVCLLSWLWALLSQGTHSNLNLIFATEWGKGKT